MSQEDLESWLKSHAMSVVHDKAGDIIEVSRSGMPPALNREVIVSLAVLPKLEKLDLQLTALRDRYFVGVTGFAQLKELNLSRTRITCSVLSAFRNSRKLETLLLTDTGRIGRGLSAIPADSLRELVLSGPEIGDEALQAAARFHNLHRLSVESPLATDKGVLSLGQLKSVKLLSISAPEDIQVLSDLFRQLPQCQGICGPLTPKQIERERTDVERMRKSWGL